MTRKLTAGERLRASLTATDHTEQQKTLLDQACRCADDLSRLEDALVDAPTVLAGSMGQERPNPLFGEVRATRALLGKLLAQINQSQSAENKARNAARARWGTNTSTRTPADIADYRKLYGTEYQNL